MHGVSPKLEFELTDKRDIHGDWRAACDRVVVERAKYYFFGCAPDTPFTVFIALLHQPRQCKDAATNLKKQHQNLVREVKGVAKVSKQSEVDCCLW